ncbi:MAG: hypothetical protein KDD31_11180 [Muricauda sp.]|nr:hypothetical protein [Allomuricauda sp.]
MKKQISLVIFFISPLFLLAQFGNVGGNTGVNMSDYISYVGGSGPSATLKSAESYLFSSWENYGSVYVGKKVFRINNINYDIKMGQFMTKTDKDSLFIYNKHSIDSIEVNGRRFKKYYDPSSENERVAFAELLFSSNDMTIAKGYYISETASSPNPMINRPTTSIKLKTSYYLVRDNALIPFGLNKRNILKELKSSELQQKAKDFAKDNHLSFNTDSDVVQILKYTLN